MKFDDDEIDMDFGYVPTVAKGSRSASMKKLTRKNQTKTAPKKQEKKIDDFDMLEDLLGPDPPKKQAPPPKKNTSYGLDSVDSFFDEPSAKLPPKQNKKSIKIETNTSKIIPVKQEPLTFSDDPIIDELSKPSTTSFAFQNNRSQFSKSLEKQVKKQEEPALAITPSLRNMKPPLRKKQSKESLRIEEGQSPLMIHEKPRQKNMNNSLGLTLSDDGDDQKSFGSKSREEKSIGKKRISIQNKNADLKLSLDDDFSKKSQWNNPQKSSLTIEESVLIHDEPSFRPIAKQENNQLKIKQQIKVEQSPPQKILTPKVTYNEPKKETLNHPPLLLRDQSKYSNHQKTLKIPDIQSQSHALNNQRQLTFIKESYEKHISSLQRNLEQQIKLNKETRENLMNECNNIIKLERNRIEQLHSEEMSRIKDMSAWEKKKMQENYQMEIQRLKRELADAKKHSQNKQTGQKGTGMGYFDISKKELQYKEDKIKLEKRSLVDREKMIDKREYELEERQREFMKRKQFEEEKLRDEERRIMKMEQDAKKHINDLKRDLESEKHEIAAEVADLELQNHKKSEKVKQTIQQLENERHGLLKQKQEMRKLNKKVLDDLKLKQEELQQREAFIKRVQTDLINKIKVIEARAAQVNAEQTQNLKITYQKQNKTQSLNYQLTDMKRPLSAHHRKEEQQKKMMDTQNRFFNISQNIKQNFKQAKPKQDFNLDKYLLDMAKYTHKDKYV